MPENNLIDGIEEFMRTLFPEYRVERECPDKQGDLTTLRQVVVVSAHGQQCLRLVVEYHYVRLWRTYPGVIGPRIKRFMQSHFNGNLAPDGKWWYETGGLGFDLREPDSLDRLGKACQALIEDFLEALALCYPV